MSRLPIALAVAAALGLAGCTGQPLLYQIMPSETDVETLAAFRLIDAGNTGQLTREQVDAYFNTRFTALDLNRDGFIDETEARSAVPIFSYKTGQALVFHLDLDGDGRLSRDEYVRLSNYLFTRDANKDGILTLAEVKEPPSETYVRSDAKGTMLKTEGR